MSRTITSDAQDARDQLREILPVGSTAGTIARYVSRSGMSRAISVVATSTDHYGQPFVMNLTGLVLRADLGFRADPNHEGIRVGGCGMDMGFHLVYSLSRALYPDGHTCTGWDRTETRRNGRTVLRCPSNDHANDYGAACRMFDDAHPAEFSQMRGHDYAVPRSGEGVRIVESYVAARQAWVREWIETRGYRRGRRHSDGGYAISQRWI